MELLAYVILGSLLGTVIGQLAVIFFEDEIFDFIDRCAKRVRSYCGLGGW